MPEAATLKETGGKAKPGAIRSAVTAAATAKETAKETAEQTAAGKRQTAILFRPAAIITMAEAKAKVKAEKAIMAAKIKKVLTTTVAATLKTTTAAAKAAGGPWRISAAAARKNRQYAEENHCPRHDDRWRNRETAA
ncbi:hypothetical protein HMSSN036_36250 [Paenibacillus macerans]|nr:hypothetical protein HMSSN036_36250 [Paenibacillus macerans]